MEIKLHEITIREVTNGYVDSGDNGVVGYGGKLNIRPAFQREFVYGEAQRNAVLETVIHGFPLNVMYWTETGDGNYELLDGQQRTISICQYVNGDFSLNNRYFHNLTQPEKDKILNYKLMIYICKGDEKEKLDWFKIINIAGVKLADQELRNAIYTGPWLSDAKRYFSKNNCPAYNLAKDYMNGSPIRQDYLETAIKWLSAKEGKTIEEYMAIHQHDEHATPLWEYFQTVITWIQDNFQYRREMKGLEWGLLYNEHGQKVLNTYEINERIKELMQDDEIQRRSGIYEYILTHDEKHLNLRAFTDNQKRLVYEKQNGLCLYCVKEKRDKIHYDIDEMEADHVKPWCEGGKTEIDNCQLLCKEHNRRKSNR